MLICAEMDSLFDMQLLTHTEKDLWQSSSSNASQVIDVLDIPSLTMV